MLRFKVHYTIGDFEDEILIEGETIEEVRETTTNQLNMRNATYEWSEEL